MRLSIIIFHLQILLGGLFYSAPLVGQNLIFNGSFEDINYCKELKQPCSPSAWFYVNDNPLGYYKRNEPNGYRNYVLLLGEFGDSVHEYWETILADELMPGKEYKLSFDLTAANDNPGCYGFLFTNTFLFSACDTFLAPPNYIPMSGGTAKVLKSGWVHIEKRFIADKEFKYLIVGKFANTCNNSKPGFAFDNLVIQTIKHYTISNKSLKDSIYALTQRHNYQKICEIKAAPKLVIPVDKKKEVDSLVIDDIQFEFNKYTILNPEVLEKFRNKFDSNRIKRIEIYGYTDSVGSERYNLNLSKLRADAVKELLINQYSISRTLIIATGKGISREFTDNKKNRRVEILVFRKTE